MGKLCYDAEVVKIAAIIPSQTTVQPGALLCSVNSALDALAEQVAARNELPSPAVRRALRLAARVAREAIGEVCGVSGEAVRLWENGRRNPSGAHLIAYVAALRVLRGGGPPT
jgi:DNA-binding transcriptional regulator YiaG